jgi:hypothetical protein
MMLMGGERGLSDHTLLSQVFIGLRRAKTLEIVSGLAAVTDRVSLLISCKYWMRKMQSITPYSVLWIVTDTNVFYVLRSLTSAGGQARDKEQVLIPPLPSAAINLHYQAVSASCFQLKLQIIRNGFIPVQMESTWAKDSHVKPDLLSLP